MPPRRATVGSDPGQPVAGETAPAALPALPSPRQPVAAAPQPAPHTTAVTSRGMLSKLIPKPDKYDGRGDVTLFIYGLINYFTLVALADATEMTEEIKILLTASFLSEAALTWYRAHAFKYSLFSKLCDALEKQFGDHNVESTARAKLERLKQTGTVASYTKIFQEIGLLLSTTEEDFFDTPEAHYDYTRGLQQDIRTAVALSQKGSKDCREAMLLASEYDAARRLGDAGTSREPDQNDRKVRFNAESPQQTRYNAGMNNNSGSFNRFNNQQQRPFFGNKPGARANSANAGTFRQPQPLCWNCGSPDHFNDACPDPPKNARLAAQRSAAQRRK